MSEHASSQSAQKTAPVTFSELDHSGTLFEGYSGPIVVRGGVEMELAHRLDLLEQLAELYGQRNQARGFSVVVDTPHMRKEVEKRVDNPDQVATAMAKKAVANASTIDEIVAGLGMANELKAAGFSYDAVQVSTGDVTKEVIRDFGEGTKSKDRQAALKDPRKLIKELKKHKLV